VSGATAAEAPVALDLELDLDVFDGPFDLLVTLILREEVDLWEVRVSRIIAEYLVRLADSGEFDLEATSQFVVMVAALLEMKSRLLLGGGEDGEDDEPDPETAAAELLARLVRYGQFRNAAAALAGRWAEHSGRLYRSAPLPAALCRRPEPARLRPAADLAAALAPLLREPPRPDTGHLADLAVSLVEELRRLRDVLRRAGRFTFREVAPAGRLERAVTFFALLELHASGEAVLHQPRPFADITVTRTAPAVAAG